MYHIENKELYIIIFLFNIKIPIDNRNYSIDIRILIIFSYLCETGFANARTFSDNDGILM